MKKILVAVIFFFFLGCAATTNFQKNAERRFAGIVADDGIGSATWMGNGYFLTARHVLTSKNGKYVGFKIFFEWSVDSSPTVVLEIDELIVLQTSITSSVSPPKFSTNKVKIGEELHWIQQFMGYHTMDHYVTFGRVARIEGDLIYIDKNIGGGSGAGVYNSKGEFIGVCRGDKEYKEYSVKDGEKALFGLIIGIPQQMIDVLKRDRVPVLEDLPAQN